MIQKQKNIKRLFFAVVTSSFESEIVDQKVFPSYVHAPAEMHASRLS